MLQILQHTSTRAVLMTVLISIFREGPCPIYLMLEKLNLKSMDKEPQGSFL